MASDLIHVEVAYAMPEHQSIISVAMPHESTVEQAISASRILQQFPEIDLAQQKVGIFSQICKLDKTLHDGDRIEIYRPLAQDPMTARRSRIKK